MIYDEGRLGNQFREDPLVSRPLMQSLRPLRAALLIAVASLALSACATKPPTIPPVQIQRVEVPVPLQCVNKADIPAEPDPVALTGDARKDDALLAAKLAAVRVWGRSLAGMLGPCAR